MSFGRSKVEAQQAGDKLLVHAAPQVLSVSVRSGEDESVVAQGRDLTRSAIGPMSSLVRHGGEIRLEEGWPTEADIGRLVLLPGGEAGILTAWWNADDLTAWRWSVEFSNHR